MPNLKCQVWNGNEPICLRYLKTGKGNSLLCQSHQSWWFMLINSLSQRKVFPFLSFINVVYRFQLVLQNLRHNLKNELWLGTTPTGLECRSPNILTPEQIIHSPTFQPHPPRFCFLIEASYFGVYHQSFRNVLQCIQYSICSEKCLSQTDTSGKQTADSVISLSKYQLQWNTGCVPKSRTDFSRHVYYFRQLPFISWLWVPPISWWLSNLSPRVQTTCLKSQITYRTREAPPGWSVGTSNPKLDSATSPLPSAHHLQPTLPLPVAPVSVSGTSTPSLILTLTPISHQCHSMGHWFYTHILPL